MNLPMYNPYQFINQPQQVRQESNSLIPIRNEQEIYSYPVAPGNSVSFRHEIEPYIYVKTMGFSQFDTPEIVKYELIKKELGTENTNPNDSSANNEKALNEDNMKLVMDEINSIKQEIEEIKQRLDALNNKQPQNQPKKGE